MENGHVAVNMNHAQLFYGLYFGMTGLHAVHIIVGIGILLALVRLWYNKGPNSYSRLRPNRNGGPILALRRPGVDLPVPTFYLMPFPH